MRVRSWNTFHLQLASSRDKLSYVLIQGVTVKVYVGLLLIGQKRKRFNRVIEQSVVHSGALHVRKTKMEYRKILYYKVYRDINNDDLGFQVNVQSRKTDFDEEMTKCCQVHREEFLQWPLLLSRTRTTVSMSVH